jgi:hypothetical protein
MKTKELGRSFLASVSKQRTYKPFVLTLMRECAGIALFQGIFIAVVVAEFIGRTRAIGAAMICGIEGKFGTLIRAESVLFVSRDDRLSTRVSE